MSHVFTLRFVKLWFNFIFQEHLSSIIYISVLYLPNTVYGTSIWLVDSVDFYYHWLVVKKPSWKMMVVVNGKDDIPYMENKSHVWNHQLDYQRGTSVISHFSQSLRPPEPPTSLSMSSPTPGRKARWCWNLTKGAIEVLMSGLGVDG